MKDRYGDRADESGSESSESSSDDSEVVSTAASFLFTLPSVHNSVPIKLLQQVVQLSSALSGTRPRNWKRLLQNFVTAEEERPKDLWDRCQVLLRWLKCYYWCCLHCLCVVLNTGSTYFAFRDIHPWWWAFNLEESSKAHVPEGLWT